MKGITLTFTQKVAGARDALNNPTYTTTDIVVDNCLIAPIIEPVSAREQQAMQQSRDQVRFHIPKLFTGDLSNSSVLWGGKTFKLDSDSVAFMDSLTPGDWDRYFRGESINA